MRRKLIALFLLMCFMLGISVEAVAKKAPKEITISAEAERKLLPKQLFGLSLEDTTTSLETGLYANYVYNNSFEESGPSASLPGWELFGAYTIESKDGMSLNNQKYLTLPEGKKQKIKNLGFCKANMQTKSKKQQKKDKDTCKASMGVEAGKGYVFSAWMKNTNTIVTVSLENEKGEKLSETNTFIVTVGSQWQKFTFPLSAAKTDYGYLLIEFAGGPVSIDNVSLVPQESYGLSNDAWKHVALRKDLFDTLKDAHPSFVRFPVICSVKDEKNGFFSWKRTIGPLEERKPASSLPTEEIMQYNSSRAIGYHEMLQLSEEIGAAPIPVVDITPLYKVQPKKTIDEETLSVEAQDVTETTTASETTTIEDSLETTEKQTEKKKKHKKKEKNTTETTTNVILETHEETRQEKLAKIEKTIYMPKTKEWQNFVKDIIDAVSYAKDSQETNWGAKRAENGHAKPFSVMQVVLKSNEVKDEAYLFATYYLKEAIQNAFPDITVLIASDFTLSEIIKAEEQERVQSSANHASLQEEETTTQIAEETEPSNGEQKTPATYAQWKELFKEENILYDLKGVQHQEDVEDLLKSLTSPTLIPAGCSLNQYLTLESKRGKIQKTMDMTKALSQAAVMVTAEANCEKLSQISFAPMLTRMDVLKPQSGFVLFNAHASIRTPSYLTMQLFLNHMGTESISADLPKDMKDLYQSVSIDAEKEVLYVKLVNLKENDEVLSYKMDGFGPIQYVDTLSVAHNNASAYNDIGNTQVSIEKDELFFTGNTVEVHVPQNSALVLRMAYGKNKADENLYKLPKIVEPTRRYTTEQKTIASNVLGGIVGVGVVIYFVIYFVKKKKDASKTE